MNNKLYNFYMTWIHFWVVAYCALLATFWIFHYPIILVLGGGFGWSDENIRWTIEYARWVVMLPTYPIWDGPIALVRAFGFNYTARDHACWFVAPFSLLFLFGTIGLLMYPFKWLWYIFMFFLSLFNGLFGLAAEKKPGSLERDNNADWYPDKTAVHERLDVLRKIAKATT